MLIFSKLHDLTQQSSATNLVCAGKLKVWIGYITPQTDVKVNSREYSAQVSIPHGQTQITPAMALLREQITVLANDTGFLRECGLRPPTAQP